MHDINVKTNFELPVARAHLTIPTIAFTSFSFSLSDSKPSLNAFSYTLHMVSIQSLDNNNCGQIKVLKSSLLFKISNVV